MFPRKSFEGVPHVWDQNNGEWVSDEWLEWFCDHDRYQNDEAPPHSLAPEGVGLEAIQG